MKTLNAIFHQTKRWFWLLFIAIISCNTPEVKSSDGKLSDTSVKKTQIQTSVDIEISWTGTLNGKTPVFLHYKLDNNLIIGEITYLNTKEKLPITLIGTVDEDKNYRLLEFEKTGNITGIITGSPSDELFNGTWFSPKNRKELVMNLIKKDTVINSVVADTRLQDIFGRYHYQYSEGGYQGDFEITKLSGSKALFGLSSVTGAPARNIAQIDDDTISLNTTRFIYDFPDTEDCDFEVRFYKGFAFIKYTKGYCEGQFGHNATVEGIFLKID